MKELKLISIFLSLMVIVLLIEYYSNIDVLISNNFYDFAKHEWFLTNQEHIKLSIIFYEGAKTIVTIIGTSCVLYILSSIKIKKYRKHIVPVLVVLLSTIIVSIVVGRLKKVTNVYCPSQYEIYEGEYPYIKLIDTYPEDFSPRRRGHCFPAGHVTSAFSLMSLFLLFKDRKKKYMALGFAISFGIVTGIYQMLRGEHFISHNVFSMLIAGLLIVIINFCVKRIFEYVQNIKETINKKRQIF